MKILAIGSRINHAEYGKGVITNIDYEDYWVTFIEIGLRTVPLETDFEIIEEADAVKDQVSMYQVEQSLRQILRRWSDASETIAMGDKWRGGNMTLTPGKEGLTGKDIPIDTFFHKIVMVRDRIRVMEQKINASKLEDDEKIELQQYITRIYGSLTTFNVLFKSTEDYFVGEKSK